MASEDLNQRISNIFRVSENNENQLVTRESTTLEFKRNFSRSKNAWNSYGKTVSAFSNTRGGFIVFGVGDRPRTLLGMSNSHFENLDSQEFTNFLNDKFSPEIHWENSIHKIGERTFGIIYVHEASDKPVVAKANGGDEIRESDVYYRYRGRSEKIKYPELKAIFEKQREKEQAMWLRHLRNIATAGVQNAAVFNPKDGRVTGQGGTFVIDRKLLPSLQFIREGEFQETAGAPALRLVGEAQILAAGEVQPTETVYEHQPIHTEDIVDAFLLQKDLSNPADFIRQVCYEATGYLPVYFFAVSAGFSINDLFRFVDNERSSMRGKYGLLERIRTKDIRLHVNIDGTDSPAADEKRRCRQALIDQEIDEPENKQQLIRRLDAIRSLRVEDVNRLYIYPNLLNWYKQFWNEDSNTRTQLNKAVAYLDFLAYGEILSEVEVST